jgi:hypothetical protein
MKVNGAFVTDKPTTSTAHIPSRAVTSPVKNIPLFVEPDDSFPFQKAFENGFLS